MTFELRVRLKLKKVHFNQKIAKERAHRNVCEMLKGKPNSLVKVNCSYKENMRSNDGHTSRNYNEECF